MNSENDSTRNTGCRPSDFDEPRVPLYSAAYAANPHGFHEAMRERYGSLAPVELAPGVPAWLVLRYRTALRILHDPRNFPADPRVWQRTIAPGCPVLPMLEWRPNALRNTGAAHRRYRQPVIAAINDVDTYRLRRTVARVAARLVEGFESGGKVELVTAYAFPLAFEVMNALLGCPRPTGERVGEGFAAMFDAADPEKAGTLLDEAFAELVAIEHRAPSNGITSALIAHPTGLDDAEVSQQLLTLYAAGLEPVANLVLNTLLLLVTDPRFGAGERSTREAIDEVLSHNPPVSNLCVTYPPNPIEIDDVVLPAHQPVVISMAGCNGDPEMVADNSGNAAHLAFGAGAHACPARDIAYIIAESAVDELLDALPEIRLSRPADTLTWRPGPFHRALTSLPVAVSPAS
ncbi:cytochrome P450 [Nocardia bovistercoris]|uniref:cytochrome P450 n=1 Tax=Nocardia bovistercoris TaxID=2785916 RepID=UPI0018AA2486